MRELGDEPELTYEERMDLKQQEIEDNEIFWNEVEVSVYEHGDDYYTMGE